MLELPPIFPSMHIIIYDVLWNVRRLCMRIVDNQAGNSNGRDERITTIDTKRQSGLLRQTKQHPAYFAFIGNAEITNPHHGRQFVLSRSSFELSPLVCTYQIKHAGRGWFQRAVKRGIQRCCRIRILWLDPDRYEKTPPHSIKSSQENSKSRLSSPAKES